MPIIVNDIRIPVPGSPGDAVEKALSRLGLGPGDVMSADVAKVSVDARHKDRITLVYSVSVNCPDEERVLSRSKDAKATLRKMTSPEIPESRIPMRPVIIGFGPAGMFAGLVLARAGARPVIFERGSEVGKRARDAESYWNGGRLDVSSNVQFGEGGAGTFSDGKLTTRINDSLCDFVISEFARFGAPEEILYRAKPHIGTDRLREVVANIRKEIISLGGEVLFDTCAGDIGIKDGRIVSVTAGGTEYPCSDCILAVGHSARDTFRMLRGRGLIMESKPFSVGFRIEHLQEDLNASQYGDPALAGVLGQADYQLSYKCGDRCAYTFCMCPGGTVVPSENEEGTIVTNGMSLFARDGVNSNSAIVCSVGPSDFGSDPFRAMDFQEETERKAYALGCGRAPASTAGRFLGNDGCSIGKITPTYMRGVHETDVCRLYPDEINDTLRSGLSAFGRKIGCFRDMEAVLTGPETRTSSPVRILRDPDTAEAVGVSGVYPCAEGAGYAGGIMSAAVDGINCAMKMLMKYEEDR